MYDKLAASYNKTTLFLFIYLLKTPIPLLISNTTLANDRIAIVIEVYFFFLQNIT